MMQSSDTLNFDIIFSLRRSKLRYAVLTYLASIYPEPSYPQAIATFLGTRPEDVKGALTGLRNKYDEGLSLVGLGLVEVINHRKKNFLKLYRLTERGVTIYKQLSKKIRLGYVGVPLIFTSKNSTDSYVLLNSKVNSVRKFL